MRESLCRFCGKKAVKKFSLIFDNESDEEGPNLLQKINSCIPVTVSTNERKSRRSFCAEFSLIFR